MTYEEIKKIINDYYDLYKSAPYSRNGRNSELDTVERLQAFGWEWEHKVAYTDFNITKGKYYITNSATKYKPDDNEYCVHWSNGNIGRLQFVSNNYYDYVSDEWNEFRERLMLYGPVDYDPLNCHIVYRVPEGKKIMEDYPAIVKEFREKFNAKIKQIKLVEAKAEYEKLLKEMEGE